MNARGGASEFRFRPTPENLFAIVFLRVVVEQHVVFGDSFALLSDLILAGGQHAKSG